MLTRTISEGIARRGFFLLIDERLKLISGKMPDSAAKINAFATEHGWKARVLHDAVFFTPDQAEAPPVLDDLPDPDLEGPPIEPSLP
jgi:hypothetical protein